MQEPRDCILVIFGASGDLTKRKLIPALFNLYVRNLLPKKFAILGTGMESFSDETFREKMKNDIIQFGSGESQDQALLLQFIKDIYYLEMDFTRRESYAHLKDHLGKIDTQYQTNQHHIYYLAIPPSLIEPIAVNLGHVGLNEQKGDNDWKHIIVEKPFGRDLKSANRLNSSLKKIFQEDQIYRIDHYLGKETVQNILVFRFANGIFEPLWNRNYIKYVEITAAEAIGVEKRGSYYDKSGALRDMVQNHLLQIVATVAMEPPAKFEANAVRNEKVKVFQSLCPVDIKQIGNQVVLGQYLSSKIRGEKVLGYRQEKDVSAQSRTETFAALKLYIDNWRWGGVPFYLRTGKRLPTRVTEIVIHFKQTPHVLFSGGGLSNFENNSLIIRVQPDEGILLKFGMKLPGSGFHIKTVGMDFHYSDLAENYIPEAYERLLLDSMAGDPTLFARADALEACWEYITPILEAYQKNPSLKIFGYSAGIWGPKEANLLFGNSSESWHYPCKNLVDDGEYCEL